MKEPSLPMEIVVLDGGFVYVGMTERVGDQVLIHDARCIISWGTTRHLGQLAKSGPQSSTTLGDPCTVRVDRSRVNHIIETRGNLWSQ